MDSFGDGKSMEFKHDSDEQFFANFDASNSVDSCKTSDDHLDPTADSSIQCDSARSGDNNFPLSEVEAFVADVRHEQNPIFIELCSGCGILSATISAAGFQVMAVDHSHNKHKTPIKTVNLDLTKSESWETLRYIIKNCRVLAVHIAPPCGTCSRAREIKLSQHWHGPQPQPLRNHEHPYGVPNTWLIFANF